MKLTRVLAMLFAAVLLTGADDFDDPNAGFGESEPAKGVVGKKEWKKGIRLVGEGGEKAAANAVPLLWFYLKKNPPESPQYERAEFHFARALDTLGYHHAAAEYYVNVARGRRDARLLAPALASLAVTVKARPFDGELILGELVSDTDFGYLPPGVEDFVAYHQGMVDFREGFPRWGQEHFDELKQDSSFFWQVRYTDALKLLAADDVAGARKIFEELDATDVHDEELAKRVDLTLARLEYESGELRSSLKRYESIPLPMEKKGPIFLERAWALYQLGDFSKALGLLVALEAPAFRDYDDPEKYTLRALMFRDVCHFEAAHRAVIDFRKEYGPAIRNIYARADLPTDETFRALALKNPDVAERAAFVDALASQKDDLSDAPRDWRDDGLLDHLRAIYDLRLEEAKRKLDLALAASTEATGDLLLDAEEQMNILDYEIELARNRRAKTKPPEVGELLVDVPWTASIQFYGFDGEFWNDEIEDIRVVLEDKCEGMTRDGKIDPKKAVSP